MSNKFFNIQNTSFRLSNIKHYGCFNSLAMRNKRHGENVSLYNQKVSLYKELFGNAFMNSVLITLKDMPTDCGFLSGMFHKFIRSDLGLNKKQTEIAKELKAINQQIKESQETKFQGYFYIVDYQNKQHEFYANDDSIMKYKSELDALLK